MEKLVFFDSEEHTTLLPLTYTKPVSEIRVGILKIQEKWQKLLDLPFSHYTQPHLSKQFSLELAQDNLFIWGALLPSQELITAISFLKTEQVLTSKGRILAARGSDLHVLKNHSQSIELSTSFDFIKQV